MQIVVCLTVVGRYEVVLLRSLAGARINIQLAGGAGQGIDLLGAPFKDWINQSVRKVKTLCV